MYPDASMRKPLMGDAAVVDPLRLADHVCFSVYATTHAFARVYRPLLEPLGLTYPQYLVMLVLWEADGRTVGEIGGALGLDSGTLTPLLKRLEGGGLVHRRRSADDERRVLVQLTEAGTAMRARAAHIPQAMLCAMGGDLDQVRAIKAALDRLRARLLAEDDGSPDN
jgi:DNA-binding MarR family transcriptional regulator